MGDPGDHATRRPGDRNARAVRVVMAAITATTLGVAVPSAARAAAPVPPPDAGLQRLVDAIVAAGAPGATLLVQDETTVRTFTSGEADVETGRSLHAEDRYRAGSISKTAVATLALQQVEAGKLALDAPVADYLPRLLPDGDVITLRQLLNHTSGLFDHAGDEEFVEQLLAGEEFRPRELVAYSTRHELLFPPGTRHSYSNTNYVVVGMILRNLVGATLRSQLVEQIFQPLGLHETSFPMYAKEIYGSHAHGYLRDPDGQLLDATYDFTPSWAWAAGALISNAPDVAALYRGLLGGDLLDPAELAEMKDTVPAGEGVGYGLGLLTLDVPCGTGYGHNGIFFGYFTFVLSTEDGSRQAVVMINVDVLNGQPPEGVEAAAMRALLRGFCGGDEPSSATLDVVPAPATSPTLELAAARSRG